MNRAERLQDPEEALRLALDARQSGMWTATPGIVTGVNLIKQTLTVRPAIMGKVTSPDGVSQDVQMPLLVDIPICWPRGGGFALTFPIAVGDEVLVVFGSRCIDSWWQGGGEGGQAELRMHDLSDGFAIPGPTSQPKKLSFVSVNSVQLRNNAGNDIIEIAPGGLINVSSQVTTSAGSAQLLQLYGDSVTIDATTTTVTSDLTVNGNMIVTGTLTVGGIVFNTHIHGSSPGPSNP